MFKKQTPPPKHPPHKEPDKPAAKVAAEPVKATIPPPAPKPATPQPELPADKDAQWKASVRELVQETRVGFNFDSAEEVNHAAELIDQLNAEGGHFACQPAVGAFRLEVWRQK